MDKWEKEFEERIRKKLSGVPVDFDPGAWEKMERRLYPGAAKGAGTSLRWLRVAAAVILLAAAGIWAYTAYMGVDGGSGSNVPLSSAEDRRPPVTSPVPADRQSEPGGQREPSAADEAARDEAAPGEPAGDKASGLAAAREPAPALKPGQARPGQPEPGRIEAGRKIQRPEEIPTIPARGLSDRIAITGAGTHGPGLTTPAPGVLPVPLTPGRRISAQQTSGQSTSGQPRPAQEPLTVGAGKEKMSLSLGLMAAPDLNGVGGFSDGKAGVNIGLGLGLHFNDRLSLHSGITYSRKPYNALPSDYQMRYSPQGLVNIAAICDVIDIPLNLRYTVYRNNANSISLSAGLSSYLMLREQYEYQYDYEDARQYEYKNENRHLMGIGNFGLSLERRISEHMSIGVEPFIKVPLTGIGQGNVRLLSAGAALRLNLDLRRKTAVPKK